MNTSNFAKDLKLNSFKDELLNGEIRLYSGLQPQTGLTIAIIDISNLVVINQSLLISFNQQPATQTGVALWAALFSGNGDFMFDLKIPDDLSYNGNQIQAGFLIVLNDITIL